MRCFKFDKKQGKTIERYGSQGATVVHLLGHTKASVVTIFLEPGGVLGLHPATEEQLFLVVAGSGEASAGAERCELSPGIAVLCEGGEEHRTQAGAEGLTAVVVEGEGLSEALVLLSAG